MRAIKFLLIWGAGVALLKYAVFDYMAQFTKDPGSLAVISFLTLMVWTVTSAIVAATKG